MIGLNTLPTPKRPRAESDSHDSETNSDSSVKSDLCGHEGECRNSCSGLRDDCNCTCHFQYNSETNSDSSTKSEDCPNPSENICVFGNCHQDVIGELYDIYCGMMEKKAAFSKMARRRRFQARTNRVDRCNSNQMCESFDKSVEDCRR